MNKKDLDLLKYKIKLAFEKIFEDFENPQKKKETIDKLNSINENQDDYSLLYQYLDALGISYGGLLNEQKIKADFFDWGDENMKKHNLNEAKRLNSNNFSTYVQNAVIRAINEWERKNLDSVQGWEHSKQRSEFYLKMVNDLKDFLQGLERAAKQDLNK